MRRVRIVRDDGKVVHEGFIPTGEMPEPGTPEYDEIDRESNYAANAITDALLAGHRCHSEVLMGRRWQALDGYGPAVPFDGPLVRIMRSDGLVLHMAPVDERNAMEFTSAFAAAALLAEANAAGYDCSVEERKSGEDEWTVQSVYPAKP